MEHYGIHLAATTSMPREIVARARQLAEEIDREKAAQNNGEKGGEDDDDDEEDVRRVNYIRLYNRLRAIARDKSKQGPDLVEYLEALRSRFMCQEDDDENDEDSDEFEEE